jgi:hypothetical protein
LYHVPFPADPFSRSNVLVVLVFKGFHVHS